MMFNLAALFFFVLARLECWPRVQSSPLFIVLNASSSGRPAWWSSFITRATSTEALRHAPACPVHGAARAGTSVRCCWSVEWSVNGALMPTVLRGHTTARYRATAWAVKTQKNQLHQCRAPRP
jgi:hypothetical protein